MKIAKPFVSICFSFIMLFSVAPKTVATEIAHWFMNEGFGKVIFDHSANGYHGDASGTSWSNYVLGFDGESDYVSILDSSLFDIETDSTYTFSFWIYPYSITGYHALFSKADASLSSDCGYCIGIQDDKLQLTHNDGSSVPQAQKTSSITVSQDTW